MAKKTVAKLTFIDLFAGIGGFRVAMESLGGTCVYSSEINPECQKTYANNFGDTPHGDITQVNAAEVPDHDVLCGGFPCQAFSRAGKMKGFDDTRGTLFFDVLRIIKEKKPKVVFLENVAFLEIHDGGNTFKVIRQHLEDEGYNVSYRVLNANNFGVPQSRPRIIIIGAKDGTFDFDKISPRPRIAIKSILQETGSFEVIEPAEYTIIDQTLWKTSANGLIFCGYRNKNIRIAGVREGSEHLSRVHKQHNRIYHVDGCHPTLSSQETSGRFWIYDGEQVRKLTIRECYRVQGFPASFKISPKATAAYRQIGNSVPVPLIKTIGKAIVEQLLTKKSKGAKK